MGVMEFKLSTIFVTYYTAPLPVTAAKQMTQTLSFVLQSDRGEQAGVCQPGGAASHDNSHQAADQFLPGRLLGPGSQGQYCHSASNL